MHSPRAPRLFPQGLKVETGVKLEHQRFPGELKLKLKLDCQGKTFAGAFNENLRLIEFKDVSRISAEDAVHNGIIFSVCCLQKRHIQ